ncbi:hypothetical protein [Vreelandella alkaliphila]|uniref:Uncharacterized protein n=1 Tax=Vreelandella alkaliphila TaxID=272774 RepID=A0AAJ2VNY9_9GAMM|nr:hypothetical protein [Halomonas alkaliphila]MDX5977203.1 hypothetical protein [Halomonas alkaliphila]
MHHTAIPETKQMHHTVIPEGGYRESSLTLPADAWEPASKWISAKSMRE